MSKTDDERLKERRTWLRSLSQDDRDFIGSWGEDAWLKKKEVEAMREQVRQEEEAEKTVEESHSQNTFKIEQELETRISELKKIEAELEDQIDENQEQIEREKKDYENWVASSNAEFKNKGWIQIEPYPKGMSIEAYNQVFTATAYVLSETQKLPIDFAKKWFSIHKGLNHVEIIYASEPIKEKDIEGTEKLFQVLNDESDIWKRFMRALTNPEVKKFMMVVTKSTKDGKPIAIFNFAVM
jgi:hypothetical protein